jgi:hypothetical protein
MDRDGGVSYRGAVYISSSCPNWSCLSRVATIFEFDVDANGNTRTQNWEWK